VAGDTPPVGRESETVIYYASTAAAEVAAAQVVAQALTGYVITALNPAMVTAGAQVTVVTGSNFSVNRPVVPPVNTPGAIGASTSVAAPPRAGAVPGATPANAPTAAVEALQAWDPRSCTAAGGEGP
jgi:hypothetical protein